MNLFLKTICILLSFLMASCSIMDTENTDIGVTLSSSKLSLNPILNKILSLGFLSNNIIEKDDYYLVDGDILFQKNDTTLSGSVQLRQSSVTTGLVTKKEIRVNLKNDAFWTKYQNSISTGLDLAIIEFNNLKSDIVISRVTDPSLADIIIKDKSDLGYIASGEYPNAGNVGSLIYVSSQYISTNNITISTIIMRGVILHNLCHCLGLKNMSDTDGILINGTPNTELTSIMNTNLVGNTNSIFSEYDKIAILTLYPRGVKGSFELNDVCDQAIKLDYNGDGLDDLMFYTPGNGKVCINRSLGNGKFRTVYSSVNGIANFTFTNLNDKAISLDYDNDGRDEIMCYRPGPNNGKVCMIKLMGDINALSLQFVAHSTTNGIGGYDFLSINDRAIAFDYNGDNKDDLLCYRPGAGNVFILKSNGTATGFQAKYATYGIGGCDLVLPQDRIIALDYNGDGFDDLLCYRPGAGFACVLHNNGNDNATGLVAYYASLLGIGGCDLILQHDKLIAWDYNGDGYDDLIGYRTGLGFATIIHNDGNVCANGFMGFYSSFSGIGGLDLTNSLDLILPLKYNNDNKSDIITYRPGSGKAYSSHGIITPPYFSRDY